MLLNKDDLINTSRYEMLQDNVEGYRKEIASLRDKCQKTTTASQKHEQTIVTLNEDLKAAKEKLSIAEVYRSCPLIYTCFFFHYSF